jgi:probable HAF family extracellular repeat protein
LRQTGEDSNEQSLAQRFVVAAAAIATAIPLVVLSEGVATAVPPANDHSLRAKLGPPFGDCMSSQDEGLHWEGKLMKRSIGTATLVIALTAFATLAEAQTVSGPPHYTVIRLPTLGGLSSNGYGGVTNNRLVSGDSSLSGDTTEHAFVWGWRDGVMTDLGTLGGMNSSVPWAQKNNLGLIVGQAQGSQTDPLGEYWGVAYGCLNGAQGICDGSHNVQLGFVWQNGVMKPPLPPLPGGHNSTATGANNLGQVVGWAETGTEDSKCVLPQKLEIHAVVYEPVGPVFYKPYALPTFPGDHLAAAFGINDKGDVVGGSGKCGTPATSAQNPAVLVHAVLWRNGRVFDLGGSSGFQGKMNNLALAINNAGQIAGIRDTSDDATTHAVLWQNNSAMTMIDLGTLPGDVLSVTADMNAKGQVVGSSCDANFSCRAFLWEKGLGMIDLNSLIPTGSPLYLTGADGINDFGEIAGTSYVQSDPTKTNTPAFLAIPAPTGEIAGDSAVKINLPANVRASLQRRLRLGHFGNRATAQQ